MEIVKAMDEIAKLNDAGGKGTVKLQGKVYTNVSTRVEVFRKHLGLEYGLDTEVMFPVKGVMMIAKVKDKEGSIVGSGHAYADSLAKDKSLEKLESVAIGRAMASIGLAGGEYASDGEIESWKERYDSGIGIEKGADDVPAPAWIEERIQNLTAFVSSPKPTKANWNKRIDKIETDPIFTKLRPDEIGVYETAKQTLETKLNERLEK